MADMPVKKAKSYLSGMEMPAAESEEEKKKKKKKKEEDDEFLGATEPTQILGSN